MRKYIKMAILSIMGISISISNVSADITIKCPLDQARRTITDKLPRGWWTTPIVSRLSEAKISRIGGKPALVCVYGSSGSVQRNVPKRHTCKAGRRSFRCSSVVSSPQTFSTRKIDVRQTFTFDLDRGQIGGNNNVDVWFQAETRDLLYLVPRNGARLSVGDRTNRGYVGCSTARFTSNRVSLRDIPVGSYVCARTNEGRISQFRVNKITSGTPKTLSIGFTTWKK